MTDPTGDLHEEIKALKGRFDTYQKHSQSRDRFEAKFADRVFALEGRAAAQAQLAETLEERIARIEQELRFRFPRL